MAHETRFRYKHRGRWVYQEDLARVRAAEAERERPEIPHINLDFLPGVDELNKLEEDEVIEYCFVCESKIPVVVDGVVVSKKRCGKRFATEEDEGVVCPFCNGEDLRYIPMAFLKLYDMKEEIRYFVTEEMKVRKGLPGASYVKLAKQIIEKYGLQGRETLRKIGEP